MRRGIPALLTLIALTSPVLSQQPEEEIRWIAQEPAGILPLEDEVGVVVRGVTGSIEVRNGKTEELRWSCSALKGGKELALAVGMTERELVVTAPASDSAARRVVVVVPARLAVRVEADATSVAGSVIESPLTVRGRELDVQLAAPGGSVELELEGGRAILDRPRGRVALRGSPKSATVTQAQSAVSLTVEGGALEIHSAQGGIDADVQNAKLGLTAASPPVHVRARGGEVVVKDLPGGGDFELSGAPLQLVAAGGEVTVNTDAPLEFRESTAEMRVHGVGASVRGSNHHGLIELETDSADVVLGKIDGPLRVRGNSLKLQLEQVAETGLITSGSSIEITRVSGPLAIENDLGDVTIQGASAKVEIKNRGGDLSLTGLSAAAVVETSSDQLTVSWASMPMDADADSVLVNEEGQVRVELPEGSQLSVEAESRYGRVESALEWIRVADDGKTAKGQRGRQGGPLLRVVGQGGVVLGGPGAAAAEEAGGGEP
jgi:hypothetical protein